MVRCRRCHSVIEKHQDNALERSFILAVTGLIFFIISNLYPLISIKKAGLTVDATLLSSSIELYRIDRPLLALLVLLTTIIVPLFSLMGIIYIFVIIKLKHYSNFTAPFFRFLRRNEIWGMLEVFLLALFVAGVKLADSADVILGISLYSFLALVLVLAWLSATIEPNKIWEATHPVKAEN
ncbi:MAG: paraquat-inducible protein A [Thiotrichaceae bacterium]|nr:paraquat-inducible protein A [Thiotrichaceae bacterium]